MGSGRTQRWLLAFLALLSLTSRSDASPLRVMSAPNLLRVGTTEKIFVECQDCIQDSNVKIKVMNFPSKKIKLEETSVKLTKENKFQTLAEIIIPATSFSKDPTIKQYVYLQAEFPEVELERVVLVSFQSGYIFIQTDKTLYTPNSVVHYRMFGVKPNMKPVEKDENTKTDPSIDIEIVTPNKITLPLQSKSLSSGLYTGTYDLGELVSPGLWTLVAKFQDNPQQSFTAEFEVKEYVLPSFEVKLKSNRPYFLVGSSELTISVSAMYLFGQEVSGVAYIIFGVEYNGQKKSFPSSVQRVQIENGEGTGKLLKQHITEIFKDIHELVGSSLYVTVSVLTENGGEMVEAELKGIQIVTSPYTINFKKTQRYFKPGMPFDVVIEVTNPDGTPVKSVDVEVVVEPNLVPGRTNENGIARLSVNTKPQPEPMTMTIKTKAPGLTQASANMTVMPYTTQNDHYIHIGLDSDDVQLGDNLKVNLNLKEPINAKYDVTYLILSKGQLVKHGRTAPRPLLSETVTVTKDMLPSFRIVAYYHTNTNEVVSDSVWVDVKDTCMGSLKLEPARRSTSYTPKKLFRFRVIGDPGATVGLVAVDKGVYVLNNKHRLSQKKIWDIVESFDTGCTPGGGKDALHVFHDAGLLFKTNLAPGSPHRLETKCPTPSRRKRASSIMDVRTSLVSQYEEKLQRACCLDGMRETPLSYDCERRSEYIGEGAACVDAFLHCCKELRNQQDERRQDSLLLARSEEEEKSYLSTDTIVSRSQFPESWLWKNIKLPPCSQSPCHTQETTITEALRDSITTWQFTAISISANHSICVADPLEVHVLKLFFIDLRLPYSAVRGEQLEIKAILHNYSEEPVDAYIDLIENQEVCSSASKRGKYRQKVNVGIKSTRSVPFVIIPMKEGKLEIEVKAFVLNSDIPMTDGIRKNLLVVPPGVLKNSLKSVTFQLSSKGDQKVEVLNSKISEINLVPNTKQLTRSLISVTGREQLSALVENALSGQSMGTLIKQPSGCGEQNMIGMTLPVIATVYLDNTNQWETVGFDKRTEAITHITTGYKNELKYHKADGSFAVFENHPKGSTWLTAYVTKVFAMASELVAMDNKIICDAVTFLMENQISGGEFTEVGTIVHGEMIGDVKGTDSGVSMTAFCLIAIQESDKICNSTVKNLANRRKAAVDYLEQRLGGLTNPYAAAIASYALANENKLNLQILNKFKNADHWPVRDKHLFTLEATAYALLALVRTKAFDEARPVVRWFNQQQIDGGGYGSTQATIMVYQAIAEYWMRAREEEYDVSVDIFLPDRSKTPTVNLNRGNHYFTRTSKVNSINNNVTVVATGKGEATVKMVSWYYALPEEKESNCQKFNLSVQLIPEKIGQDEDIYKLKISVLYKDNQRNSTMAILDIGLLTGFTANTNDLNLLSKGYGRTIAKYEMDKVLSDRGSLIIYLDKVSHKRPEEVAFRMTQTLKVGVLQPAPVSVYEYYDRQHNNSEPCVKFYHPERKAGELLRLCQKNECVCAEDNCSMQRKEKVDNDVRTTKACESQPGRRIDFVYKVRLENLTAALATDVYTVRVIDVIKEGSTDVAPEDQLRTFLSFPHCRVDLNMKIGKTYLVMGMGNDIRPDTEQNSFQYLLNERTWVEYWPSNAECNTPEHRPTCVGMEYLISMQKNFGCQMK